MAQTMPKSVFPYPGGKFYHANWIISQFPNHEVYVEPFGGAATVLVNKPQVDREVFNDLDGDIVQFFRVLRDRQDELVEWLQHTPYSRELHEKYATEYYNDYRPDDPIERAGRFFYLRNSQTANKYYSKSGFLTTPNKSTASRYANAVEKLERFSERFNTVTIENQDYSDVIELYDTPDTLFYFDPPYLDAESQYAKSSFNHQRFGQLLTDIEGYYVVSYAHLPDWVDDSTHNIARQEGGTSMSPREEPNRTKQEFLIMNYDNNGEPIMSDIGQQTLSEVGD